MPTNIFLAIAKQFDKPRFRRDRTKPIARQYSHIGQTQKRPPLIIYDK